MITIVESAKIKVLLAVFAVMALGALYSTSNQEVASVAEEDATGDQFALDIQYRSNQVENAVNEVMIQQGALTTLEYKQLCESVMATIKSERLDTEYGYNTLDESQKEVIRNYREYLNEAANVVVICYEGDTPDLTAMHAAKQKLI
jgi:zona occludens toxin (predicted ATPase)